MATKNSKLLIDDVYARMRDLIFSNALRAGQKLVDRDLAEQLGVSRTPVREALGRLAMTGLVESRSRRGYYVSTFSAEQVVDLYEFRKILEVHAVQLAAKNALPSHLHEFECILADLEKLTSDPRDHAKAVKLDLEIHELIARASGNASLHQATQNVLDKFKCFDLGRDIQQGSACRHSPRAPGPASHAQGEGCGGRRGAYPRPCRSRPGKPCKGAPGSRRYPECWSVAPPSKSGYSDQRGLNVETQLGGTL